MYKFEYLFIFLIAFSSSFFGQDLYKGEGSVYFLSEAPLETIEAKTKQLVGIVDTSTMNFAFKVNIASFDGFNSALQKEHFNEHYLETKKFPDATFLGKILLEENCKGSCKTVALCKGKFKIHGITQIVSIPMNYQLSDDMLMLNGKFTILLADYNIKIPRIVQAKISPEIVINVSVELNKQE